MNATQLTATNGNQQRKLNTAECIVGYLLNMWTKFLDIRLINIARGHIMCYMVAGMLCVIWLRACYVLSGDGYVIGWNVTTKMTS